MNKTPLVSVVIPVYNREKHLKNCLTVIKNQTYKNLEIIVVDDGSTDKSLKIANTFSSIKIIKHEKNKGQATARNTGIDNSNGKYIHFMDDDDEINNSFYENLVKASEETNADMACCSFIYEKRMNKSQIFSKKKVYATIKDKYSITYVGKYGFVWRYLYRLDFLKKNHLRFEDGRLIEDLPFAFKSVYYANKIITVPGSEYVYVNNPNSSLNTKDKKINDKTYIDYNHSKEVIHKFAKENGNFKIPAVNTGRLKYFLQKLKLSIHFCIKYRSLKYLKF